MARRMAQEAVRELLRLFGAIPDPTFFCEIQTMFSELLDLVFGAPGIEILRFFEIQKRAPKHQNRIAELRSLKMR